MPVCCFNHDYDQQYRCQYTIESSSIKVDVEYDIGKEIMLPNGAIIWSVDTNIKERDILIIDSDNQRAFLLKNARFAGKSSRYGAFDSKDTTSFVALTFFGPSQVNNLMNLLPVPKIKKIKIYSRAIGQYFGHPSITITYSNDKDSIEMLKQNMAKSISINSNNVKQISIGDDWSRHSNLFTISIEMSGYIEIEFFRRIKYTEASAYIYEIMIYLQLFNPGKFQINKMVAIIDDCGYEFFTSLRKPKYTDRPIEYSTDLGLLPFLKECYLRIPYRNSKDEIRNIPYVVMNSYRSVEDNFLMLYRFIECYYKRRGNIAFMEASIAEHFKEKHNCSNEEVERRSKEIITLRNHYVHSGYFIKNSSLRIKHQSRKKDPRDYTAKIDFDWINERTKILYSIVIDIIFVDMLGIEPYHFDRGI